MQIEILDRGQFASALVHLEPGEEFVSESGAMYLATDNIDIDVTTRAKRSGGGMLGGLKRMLGGESFLPVHLQNRPTRIPATLAWHLSTSAT